MKGFASVFWCPAQCKIFALIFQQYFSKIESLSDGPVRSRDQNNTVNKSLTGFAHSPPQGLSYSTGENHMKTKAEPLPQNVRFSAQKSRFLICATTTTVPTREGEFVQR